MERRKKLRREKGDNDKKREGFLSRLSASKDKKTKRPDLRSKHKKPIKSPSRLGKRREGLEKTREEFLSKRHRSITPKPIRRSRLKTKGLKKVEPELLPEDLEPEIADEEIGLSPAEEENPEVEGAYPEDPQGNPPPGE